MNIALGIEYAGTNYSGWQRQSHCESVQQTLEEVLSEIANQPISVFCAGRTDSRVHATGQVVNFELTNPRPLKAWHMGANTLLPDDICVRWAKEMPDEFHARHSAFSRRYRYVIQNTPHRPSHLANRVTWIKGALAEDKMHDAAQALLGEQDFSSFQAASCQSATANRCVQSVKVVRRGDFIVVDITANAFLHHMVRNIVGALLDVGKGIQSTNYIEHTLALKDRTKSSVTAKPDGLYLVHVGYPDAFGIPHLSLGPLTFS